jgi:hypothetical protein
VPGTSGRATIGARREGAWANGKTRVDAEMIRRWDLALSHAGDASAEDTEACVTELDCSHAVLTVLHADRRMVDDIGRELPRAAA